MKATRRQELKSNDLAASLEELREFFNTYGNYVLGGVVVVAVAVLSYVYLQRSSRQAQAEAFQQMQTLPFATDGDVRDSVQKLENLAAESNNPSFVVDTIRRRAAMAMDRAHAADDGEPAREFLDMAGDAYNEILQKYPDRTIDAGMALMGLATIQEDLFVLDGDLKHRDSARSYLEQVRDDARFNGTPFQAIALERLNSLGETFVQVALADPLPPPAPTPPATPAEPTATASEPKAVPTPTETAEPAAEKPQKPKKAKKPKPPSIRKVDPDKVPIELRQAVEEAMMRKQQEAERKAAEMKQADEAEDDAATDGDDAPASDNEAADSDE